MSFKYKAVGAANMLAAQAAKTRAPTTVTMQVTERCNYSCTHCFQDHEGGDELSTKEVIDILEQIADEGVLFLTLMGGEYFMRPDANEILRVAHEMGFALKLLSTGHHIHEKRADFLASIRPLQVDISVYGPNPRVHEAVTRHPGSWQRSMDAARRLLDRGVMVHLKSPVMESNAGELAELANMARELGAQYSRDAKITTFKSGTREAADPVTLRMTAATLGEFYGGEMAAHLEERFTGFTKDRAPSLQRTPCRAGRQACFIDPKGELLPCASLPNSMGSLRQMSFEEIWYGSESLEDVRNLTWARLSECNTCEVRAYCSRCHAMALIEHGKMDGPSLEACRHAVVMRDSLRERGLIPETEVAMPPTWERIDPNGQHQERAESFRGRRSRALRILP
ncbi:MAG: radical SAM protein [Myxococcales bacterium]|nr:radical SAM protein [Myxococcales bacterium]